MYTKSREIESLDLEVVNTNKPCSLVFLFPPFSGFPVSRLASPPHIICASFFCVFDKKGYFSDGTKRALAIVLYQANEEIRLLLLQFINLYHDLVFGLPLLYIVFLGSLFYVYP